MDRQEYISDKCRSILIANLVSVYTNNETFGVLEQFLQPLELRYFYSS